MNVKESRSGFESLAREIGGWTVEMYHLTNPLVWGAGGDPDGPPQLARAGVANIVGFLTSRHLYWFSEPLGAGRGRPELRAFASCA